MRNFGRHIREAFLGLFRHSANTIATIFTMFISLLLVSFFIIVVMNLAFLTKEVESSLTLSALADYEVTDVKKNAIESSIQRIEGVTKVEYRTSEQEFDYYIDQNKDLKEFYESYRDDNPFHPTFLISVENGELLADVKNKVSAIDGIESVHDGGDNTYKLVSILHDVRLSGLILVIGLFVLAVYLIYNTINLSIDGRKSEIGIMRIVGARNGFIRAPFIIEGIIHGIIGAFFSLLLSVSAYLYIYSSTSGVILGVFTLLNPMPYMLYVAGIVLGIGVLSGIIGSFISVTKSLRHFRWRK